MKMRLRLVKKLETWNLEPYLAHRAKRSDLVEGLEAIIELRSFLIFAR